MTEFLRLCLTREAASAVDVAGTRIRCSWKIGIARLLPRLPSVRLPAETIRGPECEQGLEEFPRLRRLNDLSNYTNTSHGCAG